MKRIGIITFHNSYNCGSMLESYAMQTVLSRLSDSVKIINFSNANQKKLYSVWFENNSIKNIIKNALICGHSKKISNNNLKYEEFKNSNFNLTEEFTNMNELSDENYDIVFAGSDQIWNITIQDGDDAYFLTWVKNAKKVAYAPSFGSKNIIKYADDSSKYAKYLNSFDSLSIRENNGKKWIKDLIGKDVEVLLDPTLLLEKNDYDKILANDVNLDEKYIFFYSPGFDDNICKYVRKIANKYNLKVITWSAKPYYVKKIKRFGFELPPYENPSLYLKLIKNAELILTTSYHGTIFSTIYKKKFFTIKNGGMYGDDDRVITLLEQTKMMDRLIPYEFNEEFDYLAEIDYKEYDENIKKLKEKSYKYIEDSIGVD